MERIIAEKIINRKLSDDEWNKLEKYEFKDQFNWLKSHSGGRV